MKATWHLEKHWIKARERVRVDLVDLDSPDLNHTHMTNVRPSITLVKFDGNNLISNSTNV